MEEYFMNRNKEARILGHLETMALQIVEYLHQFVFAGARNFESWVVFENL